MAKYIHYYYNQNLMVVINFQDQLQAGTFEHALHYLVTHKLDLGIFDAAAASHGERTRGLVVPRRRRAVVLSESER